MEFVNDEFWLQFAKDKINEGSTAISNTAKGLTDLLGIFLGFYIPAVAAGTILLQSRLPGMSTILLIAPVPLLLIAYILAQWVQMPLISKQVDPRIPRQVEAFYSVSIRKKKLRLLLAGFFSFLSAISISIALIISNVNPALKSEVDIAFDKRNPSKNLVVTGNLPEKTVAWGSLKTVKKNDPDSLPPIINEVFLFHTIVLKSNHFDFATVVPPVDSLMVKVSWKESEGAEITHSYERLITP